MLYPFTFDPIFKERPWGGRSLEAIYGKKLPPGRLIGESWEISDRPGDVSVIDQGPLAGRDLSWLLQNHRKELLGPLHERHDRFPLLIKILDAREKLSLQVHPPAALAARLRGEPKTEIWYLADADPGAELFAGLKRGVTRAEFEQKLQRGEVAECFHRVAVQAGDAMFVPSGRVHAIGAGSVIFEVQQNSDTTYRVFDWNRVGLDGRPRELHIAQSLESIDFNDFEPGLVTAREEGSPQARKRVLIDHECFTVTHWKLAEGSPLPLPSGTMSILGLLHGTLVLGQSASPLRIGSGQFCLVPASLGPTAARASEAAELLVIGAK